MAIDIELLLETVQAERDAAARRLMERKRVRAVLAPRRARRDDQRHVASGVVHAAAHALSIGHARDLHEHAPA